MTDSTTYSGPIKLLSGEMVKASSWVSTSRATSPAAKAKAESYIAANGLNLDDYWPIISKMAFGANGAVGLVTVKR
jgi:hypothetical protein